MISIGERIPFGSNLYNVIVEGKDLLYLLLRKGVGWLGALRGFFVGLYEIWEEFLR